MTRQIAIVLLGVFVLATPAWAITDQQLLDASKTLTQMMVKIKKLRSYVDHARHGTVADITLTATQKQDLQTAYTAEKGALVTLYNTLP